MMNIYVATQHQEVGRRVADLLIAYGHSITSSWLDVANYKSLGHEDSQRAVAAQQCEQDILASDALVLVSEPDKTLVRGGKHYETGFARAIGKRVLVLGHKENIFHWHPEIRVCDSDEQLLSAIAELEGE